MKTVLILSMAIVVNTLFPQEKSTLNTVYELLNKGDIVIDTDNYSSKLKSGNVLFFNLMETDDIIIRYPFSTSMLEDFSIDTEAADFLRLEILSKSNNKSVLVSFERGHSVARISETKFELSFGLALDYTMPYYYFFNDEYNLEYVGSFLTNTENISGVPEGISFLDIYSLNDKTVKRLKKDLVYTEIYLEDLFSEVFDKNDEKSVSTDENEIVKQLIFLPKWISVKK